MTEEQANELFKNYYDQIVAVIGDKTTYSNDLKKLGKQIFKTKFRGVYPYDKITKLRKNQMCVFNLDSSKEPCSHWIGLFFDGRHNCVYDSFGRKTSKILPNVRFNNLVESNNDKEQKKSQENCGALSLAWLCVSNKHGINLALLI